MFFLLLTLILSKDHKKPGGKIKLQKKVHRITCIRDINLFDCTSFFLRHFLLLLLSTPCPYPSEVFAEWPLQRYIILLWVVFCVITLWAKGWKYKNDLQFNTSWLTSLRTWLCFIHCFSFSCSGYDGILIKKSLKLNCYLFLQKFLLKTKTYNSLATVVAQLTANKFS